MKKCKENCQRCSWGAGNCKCPPWYSKADCDGSCKMQLLDGRCLCNSIREGQDCEYYEEDPKASGTTYLCTPAKPGQEIFVLYGNDNRKTVRKMFVAFVGDGVLYLSFKPEFTVQNISRKITFSEFRKTFFLTKEAACKAREE